MNSHRLSAKVLSLLLAFSLPGSQIFAETKESQYMAFAQNLLSSQKDLAHQQARLKFNQILATESSYLQKLSEHAADESVKASHLLSEISQMVGTYQSTSLSYDADTYKKLVRDEFTIEHQSRNIRHHIDESEKYLNEIVTYRQREAYFCENASQKVDVNHLRAHSMNSKIPKLIDYTKHESVFGGNSGKEGNWTFSSDPMVEGAALMATGTAVASAIIWSIAQGSAPAFSLSGGASVVLSGPAAAAVLVAIVVIAVVAHVWTNKENEKRRKKAEQAHRKELEKYEAAQSYYQNNKIKQSEYSAIALDICLQDESIRENIESSAQQISTLKETAESEIKKYQATKNSLQNMSLGFKSQIKNYEGNLISHYSRQFVKGLKEDTLPIAQSQLILEIFNEETKPAIEKAIKQIREGDCWQKFDAYQNLSAAMQSELEIIHLNKDHPETIKTFQIIKDQITKTLSLTKSRLDTCDELPVIKRPVYTL